RTNVFVKPNKMKKLNTIFVAALFFVGCYNLPPNHTHSFEIFTPEQHVFFTGDTVLPDYACVDTLIVLDGPGLNKAMREFQPATDWEIDSVLHQYAVILKQ